MTGPTVTARLAVDVSADDHTARMALWAVLEAAPEGAEVIVRPQPGVWPHGLLHGVPLLHLGAVTVETSDPTQARQWVTFVRATIAQQHADQTAEEAAQARREAEQAQADAAVEAWRRARAEGVA